MKKTSICLWIAIICVCAGVLICTASGLLIAFTPQSWNVNNFRTVEHTVTDPFTDIRVEALSESDLKILPAEDGQCRVVSYETERVPHTVTVENNTLLIREQDTRRWYDHINLFPVFSRPEITVYLPEEQYHTLFAEVSTGNIEIKDGFTFGDTELHSTTGNTYLRSNVTGALTVTASTGSIDVRHVTPRSLFLSVSTGHIVLSDATVTEDVTITSSTGDQSLSDIRCRNLSAQSSTGEIALRRIDASDALQFTTTTGRSSLFQTTCGTLNGAATTGKIHCEYLNVLGDLTLQTDTGDVILSLSDAANLHITTGTGDVEGTLLTEKIFNTASDTGHIRVPNGITGGICEVRTDTGDITFHIAS